MIKKPPNSGQNRNDRQVYLAVRVPYPVDKINIYTSGNRRKIDPRWFTAKTRMKEIGDALKVSEQKMYHVYFEDGSRTKLHRHNGNQILIVTQGRGSLEFFSRRGSTGGEFAMKRTKRIPLKTGDVAYIPAGVLHVHGSADRKKTFSHIAANILPRRNAEYRTVWYESNFKDRATGTIG